MNSINTSLLVTNERNYRAHINNEKPAKCRNIKQYQQQTLGPIAANSTAARKHRRAVSRTTNQVQKLQGEKKDSVEKETKSCVIS